MKQPVPFALRAILSIILTTFSLQAWGLDCAPADITLTNQAEVDALSVTECTTVTGSLRITGSVSSLEGLSNLTSMDGDLWISHNTSLTDLSGLGALTSVGSLFIQQNPALTNLNGLAALTTLELLFIHNNGDLTDLNALATLTSVGEISIGNNNALTNLNGLSALVSVGFNLHLQSIALTDLSFLAALTRVGGAFSIGGPPNLNGLDNLTSVGTLDISGSDVLTDLSGLTALTSVGSLVIQQNSALTNLNGLPDLTSLEFLFIHNNGALTDLNALATLTSVGEISIGNNNALTNVDGLANLTSVGDYLSVQSNQILDQCAGLSRLVDQWDDAEPGPGPGIGGVPDVADGVYLGDNLAGCNSIQEILFTVNPSHINPGLNDAWYYPETSGQGFFITVFPDLGYVSLAWFTYDTELPPMDATANLGDPGHRWITAVGPIEGNQVLMNIEMTSGGIFDSATEIIRTDPPGSDGTIVLTFYSCNSGTVEYDISSINRQGIVPIQRVAGDNIAFCEALNSN